MRWESGAGLASPSIFSARRHRVPVAEQSLRQRDQSAKGRAKPMARHGQCGAQLRAPRHRPAPGAARCDHQQGDRPCKSHRELARQDLTPLFEPGELGSSRVRLIAPQRTREANPERPNRAISQTGDFQVMHCAGLKKRRYKMLIRYFLSNSSGSLAFNTQSISASIS